MVKIVTEEDSLVGCKLFLYVATLKKSDVVRIVAVDEDVWLKNVSLEWIHRDRADRLIVALAEIEQAAIITSDRQITSFYAQVIW